MTLTLRQPVRQDPAPAPLAMPDQNLTAPFHDPAAPGLRPAALTLALRTLVILLPACVTFALGWLSMGWFALDGRLTLAEAGLIAISSFAFFWVVLSVGTATLGLFWRARPAVRPLHGLRVAILLPMYGEPAQATIGNAVHLLASIPRKDRHRFSLHILSDTRAPKAAAQEEVTVAALRKQHPGLPINYRRRPLNTDYKSGNIREWVQTAGHAHDAMLILDADSVMGPDTVTRLADAMAQEPGLGLIQTLPRILPGHTLWQGLQSFASQIYGVNMGRGFAMWTGTEGNFLGHNALVRIRAFATSAGLPHLPGPAPRGGVILSHDFVEAALLRRAGWGVRMLPEGDASHEDTPETLIGYLKRDQRWCQGNLQHIRLLLAPGLHPLSRFHLLQGAMAYLASVWWMALLILWALPGRDFQLTSIARQTGAWPDLFIPPPLLPALPPITQAALAAFVALMLVAPRILGIVRHIRDHGLPLAQAPRFAIKVLAEFTLSSLLAPALMVHQVRAVLRTLCGLNTGWIPHVTGRSSLPILLRFHAVETGLGAALLAFLIAGQISLWLLPIAISLCLTVPLAALVQLPRSALQIPRSRRRSA